MNEICVEKNQVFLKFLKLKKKKKKPQLSWMFYKDSAKENYY